MNRRLPHLALALLVGAVYLLGGLEFLERHLMDLRFRLLTRPATEEVVVVSIDPRSLRDLDVWPWPRGYHATVLENLLAAGARRVAFDVDFSSRSVAEEDRQLALALAAARSRAVLPVFIQRQREGRGDEGEVTTSPLEAFRKVTSLATINIRPEPDGLIRRYGPRDGTSAFPSLAAALLPAPRSWESGFHIDFGIDPETIPQISYLDVVTGRFDPEQVRGRAAIVGATAVELGDRAAVPVHTNLPGLVLQALALESLAQDRALHRTSPLLVLTVVFLVAVVLGPWIQVKSWRAGLGWALLATTGFVALSLLLQKFLPIILDLAPPLTVVIGAYGVALVRRIDRQGFRLFVETLRGRRSAAMMHEVVENSSEAIVALLEDGRIETFNPAAEALFGYTAAEALGRPIEELVPEGLACSPKAGDKARCPREGLGRRRGGGKFLLELTWTEFTLEDRTRRVCFLRDITERKTQEKALEHQATHDALTELPNRVLLQQRVETALDTARAGGSSVAFLVLDLDRFKEVNDTLGHHMGDLLLTRIAGRLREPLRASDTIARLGGDEFAILLPGFCAAGARGVAGRLIDALRQPFELQGLTLQVDASIGIAIFPAHGSDPMTLLQRADVAMYQAKKIRNTAAVYDPEADLNSVRNLTLRGQLRQAIEENHLTLHYQPKIDSRSGRIVGAEALVRWEHPEHGLVMPLEFIPLAEHTGLIKPIIRWVLDAAVGQCAAWEKQGLSLSVAVNCSARNLLEEDLPNAIEGRLHTYGLPANRLILEITETAIIEDPQRALEVVRRLASLGVRISIDDFGTGYSSLDYLKRLPARELKIDKGFVMAMADDEDSAVIVRSTIDLAHNLGLEAVAEGVTTELIWDQLREMGCELGQGYYFARPLPPAELTEWIRTSPWGIAGVEPADDVEAPLLYALGRDEPGRPDEDPTY